MSSVFTTSILKKGLKPGMDGEAFFTGRGGAGRGKVRNLMGSAGRGRGQDLCGGEGLGQETYPD